MKKNRKEGFTLLELLIVIAIIAILSVALVLVLNPAETLKKSRDAQRFSDLATIKVALALYTTGTASPVLDGGSNTKCQSTTGTWAAGMDIFYSNATTGGGGLTITDTTLDGGVGSVPASSQVATPSLTNSSGWVPVNFGLISGGSPISNLPVDPINTIASASAITSGDLVYRYGCSIDPSAKYSFEVDSALESTAYTVTDNKMKSDGGNNDGYYEVGTNLGILGTGTDF